MPGLSPAPLLSEQRMRPRARPNDAPNYRVIHALLTFSQRPRDFSSAQIISLKEQAEEAFLSQAPDLVAHG